MRWETGLTVVLTRQRGMFHVNIARDKWQTATTQAGAVINDRVPEASVRAKTLSLGFAVSTETKQEGNSNKYKTKVDSHSSCTPDKSTEHYKVMQTVTEKMFCTHDVNNVRTAAQEVIKFKWASLNLCPNFHLIFKWKNKSQLLQLCRAVWDFLNYVTNPHPTEED